MLITWKENLFSHCHLHLLLQIIQIIHLLLLTFLFFANILQTVKPQLHFSAGISLFIFIADLKCETPNSFCFCCFYSNWIGGDAAASLCFPAGVLCSQQGEVQGKQRKQVIYWDVTGSEVQSYSEVQLSYLTFTEELVNYFKQGFSNFLD